MKITTVVGTRPEMIRTSNVVKLLDAAKPYVEHTFIHTNQNAQESLKDQFYADLGLRHEDVCLPTVDCLSGAQWIGEAMKWLDNYFRGERPDRIFILGDTNSAFATAYVARRLGIPIFHAEAGNRCFDPRSPEEINRKPIDHMADVHMCYTEHSRRNLLAEGIQANRIFVVGNPIVDVALIDGVGDAPDTLKKLGVEANDYYLATLHRAENVDDARRCGVFFDVVGRLQAGHRVVVSTHPRLADAMRRNMAYAQRISWDNATFSEPFGFKAFLALERGARCVLTDSGTVPEEVALFGCGSVILRDSTERPELVDNGNVIVAGCSDVNAILAAVAAIEARSGMIRTPPAYEQPNASDTIVNIVTGRLPL